jgi:hypothetical protein
MVARYPSQRATLNELRDDIDEQVMWFNAKCQFLYFIEKDTLDDKSDAIFMNHLKHRDGPVYLPFPTVKQL